MSESNNNNISSSTQDSVLCTPSKPQSKLNTAKGKMAACVSNGDVIIEFRPTTNYNGEFGFDWLRVGDSFLPGDESSYKDILGYNINGDPNKPFIPASKEEFSKLEAVYGKLPDLMTSSDEPYYIPSLILRRGQKATLATLIHLKKKPSSIRLKYNDQKLKVNIDEIEIEHLEESTNKVGGENITIECINEFSSIEYIDVIIDENEENIGGRIKVLPNAGTYNPIDIIFIHVKVRDTYISSKQEQITTKGKRHINLFLNQCLSGIGDFNSTAINLSENIDFFERFALEDGLNFFQTVLNSEFPKFLNEVFLKNENTKYKDYYKIYLFDEPFDSSGDGYSASGQAYGIGNKEKTIVIFKDGLEDGTVTHELFHSIGLEHSYEPTAPFSFKGLETGNIMDYQDKIPFLYSWQWQWQKINPNIQL